jgi:hypothetical protein
MNRLLASTGLNSATLIGLLMCATAALGAEPPLCDDEKMVAKIPMTYVSVENNEGQAGTIVRLEAIKETLLGPPPASVNQYATLTTFVEISRYCEASAVLDTGKIEPIYWRIDQAKDGTEEYIRLDHCSAWLDIFEDGCSLVRPEKK